MSTEWNHLCRSMTSWRLGVCSIIYYKIKWAVEYLLSVLLNPAAGLVSFLSRPVKYNDCLQSASEFLAPFGKIAKYMYLTNLPIYIENLCDILMRYYLAKLLMPSATHENICILNCFCFSTRRLETLGTSNWKQDHSDLTYFCLFPWKSHSFWRTYIHQLQIISWLMTLFWIGRSEMG